MPDARGGVVHAQLLYGQVPAPPTPHLHAALDLHHAEPQLQGAQGGPVVERCRNL